MFHLIVDVPADLGDAVGQGEGHARIIRPFAWGKAVRPATPAARDCTKCAWPPELVGGTQGVADSKADHRPALPFEKRDHSEVAGACPGNSRDARSV
jgi:hypothetical protein